MGSISTIAMEEHPDWKEKADKIRCGATLSVSGKEEAEAILDYILLLHMKEARGKDVFDDMFKYLKESKYDICYLNVHHSSLGIMIAVLVKTKTAKQCHITAPGGVFGYVYNADYPDCSEWGYSWYEKKNTGTIVRIG